MGRGRVWVLACLDVVMSRSLLWSIDVARDIRLGLIGVSIR